MSTDGSKFRNSDLPAVEDRLGTEKQRDGLVRFMRECSTPMTIAVQGDWGTGKTSMMQLLQKQLEGENGCTLWFPTWQFAVLGEQDRLLMDLLMLLCCELKKSCSKMDKERKKTFQKVFRFIQRVGHAATIGGLYLAAEAGKKLTDIDIPNAMDKTIDKLESLDEEENEEESGINYTSFVMQVSELHDNLTSLIDAYLNTNGTERLYIFIDDLDRLEPVRAVELLEGIKNFLDIPRCVFMLAIDTKVVMEGLHKKYGDNMDAKKQEHFFDKIIQIPYKLPVHRYELKSYMQEVLKGYDEANVDEYVKFLEEADIRNPRTIKRCVNFCLLHQCMGTSEISSKDLKMNFHRFLVKMLELEQEDLYLNLLRIVCNSGFESDELASQLRQYMGDAYKNGVVPELFLSVLKTFGITVEIDRDMVQYDPDEMKLFAEFIFYSSPFEEDIINLSVMQMCSTLLYRMHIFENDALVHIATKVKEDGYFKISMTCGTMQFKVQCTRSDLFVYLETCLLNPDKLFNGVHRINSANWNRTLYDGLVYEKVGDNYRIWNILDTSSPDAPIYQVLRNAGIIT